MTYRYTLLIYIESRKYQHYYSLQNFGTMVKKKHNCPIKLLQIDEYKFFTFIYLFFNRSPPIFRQYFV